MRVRVVLRAVVVVLRVRFFRCELFQPDLEIVMQPAFVVIDENARRNVHGVAEQEPLLDAALLKAFFDETGDVAKFTAFGNVEPKFFSECFHRSRVCDAK